MNAEPGTGASAPSAGALPPLVWTSDWDRAMRAARVTRYVVGSAGVLFVFIALFLPAPKIGSWDLLVLLSLAVLWATPFLLYAMFVRSRFGSLVIGPLLLGIAVGYYVAFRIAVVRSSIAGFNLAAAVFIDYLLVLGWLPFDRMLARSHLER